MQRWPHQIRGVQKTLEALGRGLRKLVLTSPTGGGKSVMMQDLSADFLSRGKRVAIYTNRKLLLEQLSADLEGARVEHGIRAAGYSRDLHPRLQLVSIQTEHRRGTLTPADLVIVDEAHLFDNASARAILEKHHAQGAAYVLVTATPFIPADMADELIVAGTNSELRECGALVRAVHKGPSEPDLKAIKGLREGHDLTENQQRKAMPPKLIWGNVFDSYRRYNPERRPAILFAPGVPESVWFAQQFSAHGIRAASIDGEDVWLDGRCIPSSRACREDVIGGSQDGSIKVLCNRFVLREGVDLPWLYHALLATVFGSLQSYLQAGGRLLRSHPSLDHVVVQDHGGHWWRHGSLNEDRGWYLGISPERAYHERADRLRNKAETDAREPWRCPQCETILQGRRCAFCGYEGTKRSRAVLMAGGELKELHGDVFRPRRAYSAPDGPKLWERMYWRSRTVTGRKTFRQAYNLFAQENDWGWPCRSWPYMPLDPVDDFNQVEDVPMSRLVPKGD